MTDVHIKNGQQVCDKKCVGHCNRCVKFEKYIGNIYKIYLYIIFYLAF